MQSNQIWIRHGSNWIQHRGNPTRKHNYKGEEGRLYGWSWTLFHQRKSKSVIGRYSRGDIKLHVTAIISTRHKDCVPVFCCGYLHLVQLFPSATGSLPQRDILWCSPVPLAEISSCKTRRNFCEDLIIASFRVGLTPLFIYLSRKILSHLIVSRVLLRFLLEDLAPSPCF